MREANVLMTQTAAHGTPGRRVTIKRREDGGLDISSEPNVPPRVLDEVAARIKAAATRFPNRSPDDPELRAALAEIYAGVPALLSAAQTSVV